jgi:tetratricopeptide (TPR) repeat protein
VPRDLATICLKCLRKEADRRYATAQELADDLGRFLAGEPIRARPVGAGERAIRWCRRQPVVAGLLAALVVVFLAGLAGIFWQWQLAHQHAAEAKRSAADFQRERDVALREQERAELHLHLAQERADRLTEVGRDLLESPRHHHLGKKLLEEALTYYQKILPQEGSDRGLRLKAARLYHQVARIHHELGRWVKAVEAYDQQARLLESVLAAEPSNKEVRHQLARSYRWRGNAQRDLAKGPEARAAYDQAAVLQQQLLDESPGDAESQVTLANTLLNIASLLSPRDDAEELKRLHRRMLKLIRAAVDAQPKNLYYQSELALALESQGMFFLNTKQLASAADAIDQSLAINKKLLASGSLGRSFERYVALSYRSRGRVLAATDQPHEAEAAYRDALKLLQPLEKDFPDSLYYRLNLAETLGSLASLLTDPGRKREVETLRRQVVHHYEILTKNFKEAPGQRQNLLHSYLALGHVLGKLGDWAQSAEQYRKAVQLDPKSPEANNELAWLLATSPETGLRNAAEAMRLAQVAITAAPKSGWIRNTLGVARYRQGDYAGAIADLEESMRLRDGGDSFDWFFLAMAHCRLGDRAKARLWFDRAVQWMDKHQPHNEQFRRFRAEAEALLAETGP